MMEHIGVVGAGTMGRGVVWALAQSGISVAFKEASPEKAQQSLNLLEADLDCEIERWSLTKSEKAAILSRVRAVMSLEELSRVSAVIECLPDHFEAKTAIYQDLSDAVPEEVIFITNTSSLSITELSVKTNRPERFVGMHFSRPVAKRPLVEIVRGLKTSDETAAQARRLAESMGKTAVEVFEYPGFVTTRIILPFLNEAMHVVMEGVATAEDVDTAMKLGYDMPIGPLTLADKIGLDEVMLWMEQLFHELGELKYRPCPLLRKMVRAGHCGVKTGRGFFAYDSAGRRTTSESTPTAISVGGVT